VILLAGELKDVDLLKLLSRSVSFMTWARPYPAMSPPSDQRAGDDRAERERADLITLCAPRFPKTSEPRSIVAVG
jgi:putative hydrolase of HD superfamily